MPVQTACSSCSAKLKVKDDLIGKSIKCPKCSTVFKVAAEGVASAQTERAQKPAGKQPPPPPAWEDEDGEEDEKPKSKPKPKAKTFDDDDDRDEDAPFNELLAGTQLSDNTKKQIQSDLGLREKGVWVGQPDPKIMAVRALVKSALGFFVITIMCIVFGAVGTSALGALGYLAPWGSALFWLLLTPLIVIGIPFMDRRKALATAYVITNRRCIVYTANWFGSVTPESYQPDRLQHMRRMQSWFFGADAGDLVFRSVTTITTTHHARGGTSTSTSTAYYGFLGIRALDETERRIRQALLVDDDDDDDEEEEDRRRRKKKPSKRRDDD